MSGEHLSLAALPELLSDLAARVRSLETEVGTLRDHHRGDGSEWVPARDAAEAFPSIFKSYESVRWTLRRHRTELEAAGAIRQRAERGPIFLHRHRFLDWWRREGEGRRS